MRIKAHCLDFSKSNDNKEGIFAVSKEEDLNLAWLEVSCAALSIVQHQLLLPSLHTPSEPGPDPPCNYTLHFTDMANPTGDSTGTRGGLGGGRRPRWHSASLLAPSHAEPPVSSCYLLLLVRVRGVFALVLGFVRVAPANSRPRKRCLSIHGDCRSPHPGAINTQPCSERGCLTAVFRNSPFQAMLKKNCFTSV